MRSGRHFLQIPGPSNVPDRILRAMDRPVIDHRGPEFSQMALDIQEGLKRVFQTQDPVLIFPASGSGGAEAALVNLLSPGQRVLAFVNGFFAAGWARLAERIGATVERLECDWRRGAEEQVEAARTILKADTGIRAVLLVHNETSTGVRSSVSAIRQLLDELNHPALLLVDTISSLACMEYRHDDWGVDVTVASSQKGLMLPPGLAFNAVSSRARKASQEARMQRSYWDWKPALSVLEKGFFPYTPATNLLYGLQEALKILEEEGLEQVFSRHLRLARSTRSAVEAWGLENVCQSNQSASNSLTAAFLPEGFDSNELRGLILERFDLSLGTGLGELEGRAFRIGHLGSFNELMLCGTLAGVEMGLRIAKVPLKASGLQAAKEELLNG